MFQVSLTAGRQNPTSTLRSNYATGFTAGGKPFITIDSATLAKHKSLKVFLDFSTTTRHLGAALNGFREGVVVQNHMIGVGMLLPLSLSCDHRVIDGGTAAQALAKMIELLQNPEDLLPAKQ